MKKKIKNTFRRETIAGIRPSFPPQNLDDDEDYGQKDDEGQAEANAQGQVGGRDGGRRLGHRLGPVDDDGVKANWNRIEKDGYK